MNTLSTVDTDAKSLFIEEQITETITKKRHFWQSKKFIAAMSMAIASIALLGYLIHINLPDLSVKVAAMQTGINAAYPTYIPAGYHMDGLVSEKNGKIEMTFKKSDTTFTLTEERSSWDSSAVLTNFVQPKWGNDYTIARESGLTLYISGSNAAWVSGGILYTIQSTGASLTKQNLHDIALSL
jgi:hypothetical protein